MLSKHSYLHTLLIFLCLNLCSGKNFPTLDYTNYCRESDEQCESDVILYVNRLNTENNLLPYEYHDFDFCPINEENSPIENLGQMVFGDRIHPGPYKIDFLKDVSCAKVCTRTYLKKSEDSEKRLDTLKKGIRLNYQHHWIVDHMPVNWCYYLDSNKKYCISGFPIGCILRPDSYDCPINAIHSKPYYYYPFNHVALTITYNSGEFENWGDGIDGRITSIEAKPTSINHHDPDKLDCNSMEPLAIPPNTDNITIAITYSYSVKFILDNSVKWSSRLDYVLASMMYSSTQLHWYNLLNATVIIFFLSGMIARVLMKIDKTNCQTSWQLIKDDLTRAPCNSMLLSIFIGSGVQLFGSASVTLVLACMGFLSPPNGGALMTCAILLYSLFGLAAGYVSARIYKSFGGVRWKINVLLMLTHCPGLVFGLFCIMNLVLLNHGSSGAVSFNAFITLLSLWFCVSVPLMFIGAHFGYNSTPLAQTVDNKHIPHLTPIPSNYIRSIMSILWGGLLPFGCIFLQTFFILNTIWTDRIYNMFGFSLCVFCLLVITSAESTMLLCYFNLRSNNYRWQWQSFVTSGCTAFYLFLYSWHYFVTKLSIEDSTSIFLYFGYMLIMAYLFFLMTGTIGFMACFWFIQRINKD